MKAFQLTLLMLVLTTMLVAQKKAVINKQTIAVKQVSAKPKLVVGMVVDQMRWDFLYRYANRYSKNGFNRMLNEGMNCVNAYIPYTPTVTAVGHTCVYTGSVPSVHGIVGNAWIDRKTQKSVYCSEDSTVQTVGSSSKNGKMSPKNMLVTTIGDELRLASNFRSKVIGIALKDRGAILPAGHSANAAYWYDNTNGKWITSTHYMNQLPDWVNQMNNRQLVDSFYQLNWQTLYPIATYTQSTTDVKAYESTPFGAEQKGFPYQLQQFKGKNYGAIATTPYGNSITFEMAKAAIVNEQLGKRGETDMLCVSFSSPDYIGHSFGPNSIETEDNYLRLDLEMAAFFQFLDKEIGANNYTVFLTADHGVAHVPQFLKDNNLPGGVFDDKAVQQELNTLLKEKFGKDKLVISMYNYQVHFNHAVLDTTDIDMEDIVNVVKKHLYKNEAVASVFDLSELQEYPMNEKIRKMLNSGYFHQRSGDVQFVLKPGYIDGGKTGTTHGIWSPYDAHIPMVFMGAGINKGKLVRETYMTDFAPTIATLLNIQMPNGTVGNAIPEVLK